MIVHTNIEKHAIFYTIMHGLQICTINKRLVLMLEYLYVLLYSKEQQPHLKHAHRHLAKDETMAITI